MKVKIETRTHTQEVEKCILLKNVYFGLVRTRGHIKDKIPHWPKNSLFFRDEWKIRPGTKPYIIDVGVNGCATIVGFHETIAKSLKLITIDDIDERSTASLVIEIKNVARLVKYSSANYDLSKFTEENTIKVTSPGLMKLVSELVPDGKVSKKSFWVSANQFRVRLQAPEIRKHYYWLSSCWGSQTSSWAQLHHLLRWSPEISMTYWWQWKASTPFHGVA